MNSGRARPRSLLHLVVVAESHLVEETKVRDLQ